MGVMMGPPVTGGLEVLAVTSDGRESSSGAPLEARVCMRKRLDADAPWNAPDEDPPPGTAGEDAEPELDAEGNPVERPAPVDYKGIAKRLAMATTPAEGEDEVDHLQRYLAMQSFTVGVHHPKKHPFDNDSKTPQSPETRLALSALKGRRRAQQFSTGVRHLRNTRPS